MAKFAFIIDGEVAAVHTSPDSVDGVEVRPEAFDRWDAIMRSNPKLVEILTEDGPVTGGWTWDETGFHEPSI